MNIKAEREMQKTEDLGHNFTGPTDECFYCGYERDEVIRYWLDCEKLQTLEMTKMLNENLMAIKKELVHLSKEIECTRLVIRNK